MADDPLAWIADEITALERQGLRRRLTRRAGRQGAMIASPAPIKPGIPTSGGERTLVNFASNDYLALAADPRLIAAAHAAAEIEGWGAGASPLVSGYSASHLRLEEWLAELLGTEAAIVMPSGFAANVGTISRSGWPRRRGLWRQQESRQFDRWLPLVAGGSLRLSA